VGILEKIVQSLTANTKALQQKELEAQYRAQMDVLEQLQEKIMKLLQQQTQTTAVTKLQRDFERVKQRVTVIEDGVERILKSQKQQLANKSILDNTSAPETAEDSYQRMQLQMQQDVSGGLHVLFSRVLPNRHLLFLYRVLSFINTATCRRNYARTRRRDSKY
jgi:hypothetical protein